MVGVEYMGICVLRCLKGELAWATHKRLQIISNIMCYATMKLKNRAVSSLNNIVCVPVQSLVTYSNCFVIFYRLMLHSFNIKVCFYVQFCLLLYHYTINNDYTWCYICSTWYLDNRILTCFTEKGKCYNVFGDITSYSIVRQVLLHKFLIGLR